MRLNIHISLYAQVKDFVRNLIAFTIMEDMG